MSRLELRKDTVVAISHQIWKYYPSYFPTPKNWPITILIKNKEQVCLKQDVVQIWRNNKRGKELESLAMNEKQEISIYYSLTDQSIPHASYINIPFHEFKSSLLAL